MKKKTRTYVESYALVERAARQMKQKRGKYYERWKADMELWRKRGTRLS